MGRPRSDQKTCWRFSNGWRLTRIAPQVCVRMPKDSLSIKKANKVWRLQCAEPLSAAAALLSSSPPPALRRGPDDARPVIAQSTNVCIMHVVKVDKEKNLIIYRKSPTSKASTRPGQSSSTTSAAAGFGPASGRDHELGRGRQDGRLLPQRRGQRDLHRQLTWYQAYPQRRVVGHVHGEPFLLRSYAGKVEKLAGHRRGDARRQGSHRARAWWTATRKTCTRRPRKIQRLKASLKLQDYNPKRDFVGWGGEDFRRLAGMPGFTHIRRARQASIPRPRPISVVDFDGDGKPDSASSAASKVVLLQNGGDRCSEVVAAGRHRRRRAAVWADYNGDGLPDLLLATPTGPKLFTNLGKGQFRDDTPSAAAGSRLQPDRGRLDRLRRRRQARHPARQRLPRPAALPQHPAARRRKVAAAEARRLALHRPVRQRRQRRLRHRAIRPRRTSTCKASTTASGTAKVGWKKGKFTDGADQQPRALRAEHERRRGRLPLSRDRRRRRRRNCRSRSAATTRSPSGSTARSSSPNNATARPRPIRTS